jgi:hypothetical protein
MRQTDQLSDKQNEQTKQADISELVRDSQENLKQFIKRKGQLGILFSVVSLKSDHQKLCSLLGSDESHSRQLLSDFVSFFDFKGQDLLQSLRRFLCLI